MNKKKLIALLLVVSLMLMGVGYASWTQTFSIESYADTGKLEVILLTDWDEYALDRTDFDQSTLPAGYRYRYYSQALNELENDRVAVDAGDLVWSYDDSKDLIVADFIQDTTYNNTYGFEEDTYMSYHMDTVPNSSDLLIRVSNMYPGANFTTRMMHLNVGTLPVAYTTIPSETDLEGNVRFAGEDDISQFLMDSGLIEIEVTYLDSLTYVYDENAQTGIDTVISSPGIIKPGDLARFDVVIEVNHTMLDEILASPEANTLGISGMSTELFDNIGFIINFNYIQDTTN
jgi:hypothetical protein